MKARSPARWLAGFSVVALVVSGSVSAAELHVMISAGFYRVYAELGPAFERATGHRLITTRGPSIGDSPEAIPTRLARGEFADVVILDGGSADELAKRGFVRAGSKVDLALSQIGMVVRSGAASPNIGNVEAFRRTLLAAKSIGTRTAAAAPICRPRCSQSSASRTRWQARVEKCAGRLPVNQSPRSLHVARWKLASNRSAS